MSVGNYIRKISCSHNEDGVSERKVVITAKNGITFMLYPRSDCTSVKMGIFVRAGAWNENKKESGIAHVIEHMMFKSSMKHTTNWINDRFAELGATVNAYTDWDQTCYHATVPCQNTKEMFTLLTEMMRTPKFDDAELNTERKAILAEINRRNDQHTTMTMEAAHSKLFSKDPRFSGAIIGEAKVVEKLKGADLKRFCKKYYVGNNIGIILAGRFDPNEFMEYATDLWKDLPAGKLSTREISSYGVGSNTIDRNSEQAHFVQMMHAEILFNSREMHAANILATLYGSGCSSRLYREIREKRGLAYQCCMYGGFYGHNHVVFTTYVGTFPKSIDQVKKLVEKIQDDLTSKPITKKELERTKAHLVGMGMVEHDDLDQFVRCAGAAWVTSDQKDEFAYDTYEIINKIKSVTVEEVHAVAQKIFCDCDNWTTVGMKE